MEKPETRSPDVGLAGVSLGCSHRPLLWVPVPRPDYFIDFFFVGSIIFGSSLVTLLVYRFRTYKPKILDIKYSADTGTGDILRLDYANQMGKTRNGVRVKKVVVRPDTPLMKPTGQYLRAIQGLRASIVIQLENQLFLELGFADSREMFATCQLIGDAH